MLEENKPDSPKQGQDFLRHTRRIMIFVFGITLLLIGIALIVLPGPALVVIPLSFVVLSTEFVWARRLKKKFHFHFKNLLPQRIQKFFKD